jgi:hypothetical protein
MVEKSESKPTRKETGCLQTFLAVSLIIALASSGLYFLNREIKADTKTEQGILQEIGLPGLHPLVPLSQMGPEFKDVPGYFTYQEIIDTEGNKVSGIEFACEIAGKKQLLKIPKAKATAVVGDQNSTVLFDINPTHLLGGWSVFLHPVKYGNINGYVSRSESITFSLSQSDLTNFKGPK